MLKSVVGLILMLHLFSPGQVMQASAAIQAIATNPATQRVESGTLKMGAVSVTSSGLQAGTALSLPAKKDYFFVKNFGTLPLRSFTLSQTGSATITYCRGLGFGTSPPSYEFCSDGSAATVLGAANLISNIALASTLGPGQSHQFAAVTTANSNSVSILVTPANR
jgi:hypothetical protein